MKNKLNDFKKAIILRYKKVVKKLRKRSKEGFKLVELLIVIAITTTMGLVGGSLITYSIVKPSSLCDKKVTINNELKEFSNTYESIIDNYYKDVDHKKLIDAALNGMLSSLEDPYSSFFDATQKKEFDERMEGEYTGIGVELLMDTNNNIVIANVFTNTPAEKAGLKAGDKITALDGKTTTGMTSSDVAVAIKTSTATNFKITIDRNGQTSTLDVEKARVKINSVTSNTFERNGKKIGYLKLKIFANNSYTQFKDALTELEKSNINSLIIDVRDNSGGYLRTANDILSLFFKKNTILYQLSTKSKTVKKVDQTEEARSYPIAVLINSQSASASEILAAAFKENGNSHIIGGTSYGKGTVQQAQDLSDGTMFKFTIQKWLTPKGNWINGKGVVPTDEVLMNSTYYDNQTIENDNQLQSAIDIMSK